MPGNNSGKNSFVYKRPVLLALMILLFVVAGSSMLFWVRAQKKNRVSSSTISVQKFPDTFKVATNARVQADTVSPVTVNKVDTILYNQFITHIVNGDTSGRWPVKTGYPDAGAILPFKRIVAFYGNLYSKNMGILGELPPKEMLEKLQGEVEKWHMADSAVEVIPALHYIASTAQLSPGNGGKYRLRMPPKQIDLVLEMAKKIDAIVILDIQVGLSTLESEIPALEKYLMMPNVHLGIDPEFSMKTGHAPGKVVGSFDAADINYASNYLAELVTKNNLPPKILVVHRFTQGMITNYKQINKLPQVQIVMDMDGWGAQRLKLDTYRAYIYREPVQFTGFKLFYKNDTKSKSSLFTPAELLKLKPQPVYIQYQ